MIGADDAPGVPIRARPAGPDDTTREVPVVALVVMVGPPRLIAFLLVMERVEEPLRRPPSQREVEEFLGTASAGEVDTLTQSGIRRALGRWRQRRRRGRTSNPPMV
jgi:hypothetical protein